MRSEKFFIVTNEQFLKETRDFRKNEEERNALIKEFYEKKGISGNGYYIRGDGRVNRPFEEYNKKDIRLYIGDCEENEAKFGKQLLKAVRFDDGFYMRRFRANSAVLKEFQNLCIERRIIINNWWHKEGDWFKELHMGGYSVTRFELDGKYYLRIETSKSEITPEHDGFNEIKGSEFYLAVEKFKLKNGERL